MGHDELKIRNVRYFEHFFGKMFSALLKIGKKYGIVHMSHGVKITESDFNVCGE
jgi:hypothetical protein